MPEFGEKQIKKIQNTAEKASAAVLQFKARLIALAKSVFYWSSVVTVGLTLSAVIAHVGFGVEIFEVASAKTAGEVIAIVLGNILYYGVFGVVLLAALVVSYILEIVLLYPYGEPSIFPAWSGNGFVNVDQVVLGWKLVRDICNIFFSLILVIIAMASVLKIEAYSWKQLMPKFFIAVILINFSKSIAGIFTDFATIAMATFGSSFQGSFARGLIGGFGLPVLGDFAQGTDNDPNTNGSGTASILFAYVAAAAMAAIFFILMLVFAATLIFRIIMLWFLIVLSPLAYITRILPLTQRYSSQWWEMFGRYVVVGPLVTFFLWLSLTMAFGGQSSAASAGTTVGQGFNSNNVLTDGIARGTSQVASSRGITQPPAVGNFQSTNPNVLANFMIATLLLMGSLKLISQMAQEFGKFTGAIEAKAGGVMARSAEKMGQMGISAGKWGREPKVENGQIVDRGNPSWYIGQGIAALSATVGQPLSFAKSVVENIAKSSEGKQEAARVQATQIASGLRNQDVLGRGDTGGKIVGSLVNVAGTLMGAGMKDGRVVWDNYLSGQGMMRGAKKIVTAQTTLDKIDVQRKIAGEFGEAIKKEEGKLSEEEVGEAYQHYLDARQNVDGIETMQKALNTAKSNGLFADEATGEVNTDALKASFLDASNEQVRAFLQDQISRLYQQQMRLQGAGKPEAANEIGAQIGLLQEAVNSGTNINVGDFMASFNGQASLSADKGGYTDPAQRRKVHEDTFGRVSELFGNIAKSATTDRDALAEMFIRTGYTVGADGKIDLSKRDEKDPEKAFRNQEKLDGYRDQKFEAEKYAARLARELAALGGDDGYETLKVQEEAIGEAMKSLQGVFHPEQLIERMLKAERAGDTYGALAAIRRLQETGNLNELTGDHMAVGPNGKFEPRAGTGSKSIHFMVDTVLKNMTGRQRRQVKADLGIREFLNGNYANALGMQYSGGQWIEIPEELRRQIVIGEAIKQGAKKFASVGRFGHFAEDGRRKAMLEPDEFGEQIGPQLMRFFGPQLGDDFVLNQIQPKIYEGYNANPTTMAELSEYVPGFVQRGHTYLLQLSANGLPRSPKRSQFIAR